MPNRVRAYANNDVAFIAWEYDKPIPSCLGFSIHRTDETGATVPLPAWVGFKGQGNEDWKLSTTDE